MALVEEPAIPPPPLEHEVPGVTDLDGTGRDLLAKVCMTPSQQNGETLVLLKTRWCLLVSIFRLDMN